MPGADVLIRNATVATMAPGAAYGLVEAGAVARARRARSPGSGPTPRRPAAGGREVVDLGGRLLTPALIDCHTHVVFGGDRAREFEMRLEGASYEEVARAGGGIVSTVRATRAADEAELLAGALPRVDALIAEGVAAIEIKSGYGLDRGDRAPDAAGGAGDRPRCGRCGCGRASSGRTRCRRGRTADAYIDEVCIPTLQARRMARGWSTRSTASARASPSRRRRCARVFEAARGLGLPVKMHAEQLSNLGGARLAAEFGGAVGGPSGVSRRGGGGGDGGGGDGGGDPAGRLLHAARDAGAAGRGACARQGVPMAVATDCNPGSSPMASLLLAMNMACTLFRLTPEEALAGATREAARALGLDDCGRIAPGLRADLAVWDARASGGARLSHRLQPAAVAHLRRRRHDVTLTPGATRLAELRGGLARRRRGGARPRRRGRRSRRRRRASRRRRRAARRSTGSTPASASSRA